MWYSTKAGTTIRTRHQARNRRHGYLRALRFRSGDQPKHNGQMIKSTLSVRNRMDDLIRRVMGISESKSITANQASALIDSVSWMDLALNRVDQVLDSMEKGSQIPCDVMGDSGRDMDDNYLTAIVDGSYGKAQIAYPDNK